MAISNRDRIGKALDEVRDALLPFISNELSSKIGLGWESKLPTNANNLQDISILLGLFMEYWNTIFKKILSQSDRAYISELKEARNKWAHSQPMSSDDVDRYLDTSIRLCKNINAFDQSEVIRRIRDELQQQIFSERARHRTRYQASIENQYQKGLKPWRDIIVPHRDVIEGKYHQAKFAADLDQVQRKIASSEYGDPIEFYRRTFITDGLKDLLSNALKRFNNKGGEPVIELQTNFGGGKTHSMLALYHLCSGLELDNLTGLDQLCSEIGISSIPKSSRAVLVGTAFNPTKIDHKDDGTYVRTLWGELAWQLGGKQGYSLIEESDRQQVPPGARDLASLFKRHGPCLILIDEWVAYARNLVSNSKLPAGTFDAQLTFAQELTEAVKQVSNALLLISVPQSRNEIGGSDGEFACDGLKNVVSRIAYQWRPATGNESYEIVTRRLFEPIQTKTDGASRDAVIRTFCDMYNLNKAEFPSDAREVKYKDVMTSSYPIHPDLFKTLYEEWSTLDRFQRTRGVLRLLALTIESLWNGNSKDLLIMPSSIPMDDNNVKNELVRFLDNQWEPIISTDVDGPSSIPTNLDKEYPNFGRLSACKRVARSLYIGTAPRSERQRKGINDQSVKLACVMPGEPIPIFGDALRKLGDRGKYIQQDGDRYWIDTRANLNRTADDYKESYLRKNDDLIFELNSLIQTESKKRDKFAGIHAGQIENSEIPDNQDTRLVILAAQYSHRKGIEDSKAIIWIQDCLKNKGNTQREYINALIFLAPDEKNLNNLMISLAEKRAWQRIKDERMTLNLTATQENQADLKIEQLKTIIKIRISETWSHLLVPHQNRPGINELKIDHKRINIGEGSLAGEVYKKCLQEDFLYQELGARLIRDKLNDFLWEGKSHVRVSELVDWCKKFPYLPRTISNGIILEGLTNNRAALSGEETFYLAENFDEISNKYQGLIPQFKCNFLPTLNSYIVKTSIAKTQLENTDNLSEISENNNLEESPISQGNDRELPNSTNKIKNTTFKASLKLDPISASLKTSQFMSEVMSHLQALPGSEIELSLDIEVKNENGIDNQTARIIIENSKSLKVDNPEIF